MRLGLRLGINPIIVKELRARMRGARAFAMLTGVLLLLGLISYLLYRVMLSRLQYSSVPISPQIGQSLFIGLAFIELMMVCFISPAATAGSISGEREKLTYEMLLATPLRPASILWGKLIAALSYVFLLIFAALPMASLVFIFGGVAVRDMIKALIVVVATAITLGVVGMFMSVCLRRTVRATVLTYLAVLALLFGPLMTYVFVGVIRNAEPPRWLLVPNPVSALFSALSPSTSTVGGAADVLRQLGRILSGDLQSMTGQPASGIPRPLYHYTLPLYGVLSLVLYLLAARLIRPTRRWRVRWSELLLALAVLLALGGATTTVFLTTADRYERVRLSSRPAPAPFGAPPVVERVVVEKEVVRVVEVTPAPTPTPTPPPPPTTHPGAKQPSVPLMLSEENQVDIYAAVLRQLYTVDHTFGEPPNFPVVYLVKATDDGVGDPDAPRAESQVLPESVRAAIIEALSDLPAEFRWVDDADEVPRDSRTHAVASGGAIFTVGNIHGQEDGTALVSASLYFAMLGAGGQTYVLQQADGTWEVVGDTGARWIS